MKKIIAVLFFLLTLLFTHDLFAQTGIKGVVKDKKNGETQIGANVVVVGVEGKGAATGLDGDFEIVIGPGKYTLKCTYVSYKVKTVDVEVVEGKMTEVVIALDPDIEILDEVVVKEVKVENTVNAGINEEKKEDQVTDVMTAEEIKASASNRDASDVARRVPGVTVVDNRFVMVRGLTERYNAVLLNNALTPSSETDVKSFSFDLVPSQMIDRFVVYKSPSADLPGEFAGGAIKIFTRNIPEKTGISGGYSLGYRSGTTFNEFASNGGSSTDWLGFGKGGRELPSGFPSNVRDVTDPAQLQSMGQSLNGDWSVKRQNALPDQRFNINVDQLWESKDKGWKLGSITSLNYSNTWMNFVSNRLDYNTYDKTNQHSDTVFYYHDTLFQKQVRLGVLQNFGFSWGDHTINFRNLFNQMGMNESTLRGGSNYEEGNDRKENAYRYNQRSIYSGQLTGRHLLGAEKAESKVGELDWTIGYSLARRSDPDWRRVRYTRALGTQDPYSAYIPFSAQPFYLGRLFLDMKEDIKMAAANYEHRFVFYDKDSVLKDFQPKLKAGFYIENKDRSFSIRNIGYSIANIMTFDWTIPYQSIDSLFQNANINNTTGLEIDEDTKGSDSYLASNRLRSYYLMATLPFTKRINLVTGMRVEDNTQKLNSSTTAGDTVMVNNHIVSWLPSANFSFHIKQDTMLIRVAYGRTVNRPEFRELAPLYFYDFVFNSIYSGNDSLKTPSIDNFDLRWELYPRTGESVSAGFFYKRFTNPIEMYFVPGVGSGGTRSFTYGNAPLAVSYGVEIDVRKSFEGMTKSKFINDLTLVLNASYIKSEIKLNDNDNLNTGVGKTRPMMGQSPYIINAGLYYQNDSCDLSVNILYNRIGQRVAIVGVPGIPEVYEMPRNLLDITITKGIGKYVDLRLGIQDVLNAKFVLLQDANEDGKLDVNNDQQMQFYRRGTYVTFGATFQIFKEEKKVTE